MHSAEEVLRALRARFDSAGLAEVLGRILRVPAAWQMLHHPEFLAAFQAAPLPAELAPGHLASLALGGELRTPVGPQSAAKWADRSRKSWEAFLASTEPPQDLVQLALLAVELGLQGSIGPTLELARHDPRRWQDVLAVAWAGHPQRQELLADLLAEADGAGMRLATHVALSNLSASDAAQHLIAVGSLPGHALVRGLQKLGELAAAEQALDGLPQSAGTIPVDRLLMAERSMAAGDSRQAYEALQEAWAAASTAAAEVADRMADYAGAQGDPVLASEASRRALENGPSPERRAVHALCLLKLGRAHDAQAALADGSTSIEEQIALGSALAELGQPVQARGVMESACDDICRGQVVADRWMAELAAGLQQLGAIDSAVRIAESRAERTPASIEARRAAVQLLEAAGDPEGAARQAMLAVSLEPASQQGLLSLAKNLLASGEAASALPHWEVLLQTGAASPLDLAGCALAAGQLELAQAHCARLLESDPGSADASTLMARCLSSGGDHAAAEARLRQVVAEHPDHVEARLALADALTAAGQDPEAGEVLFAASQALPHEVRLRLALSRWLRGQGRPSEAVQAVLPGEVENPPVELLVEFGEASLEVGEQGTARKVLRMAADRQPGNWRARLGLARAYELGGEVLQAGEQVGALPKSATAEALIHAARIGILAAEAKGDAGGVQTAVDHLSRAAAKSPGNPSIELWSGRALEVAGRPAEALGTYQRCLARLAGEDADSYGAALLGIGRSAIATGELSLALSTLEQAQKRFPTSSEILCLLSQAYAAANLPEKSVESAERAVHINGRHAGSWKTLGRARAAAGDLEGALKAYQGLSAVEPESANGWLELARLSRSTPPIARQALAEALVRGRRSPQVLTEAAEMLVETDSRHDALRLLKTATAIDPDDLPTLTRLAELSDELGKLEISQRAWSRLAQLRPVDATAHRKRAEALWALGSGEAAIEAWQRALELEPHDSEVSRALGRAYMQRGDVRQALNHYGAAVELNPKDASLPLEAGVAAMQRGSMLESAGLLAEAVERDPSSAEAWAALGECGVRMGEWTKADEALSRAHDLMAKSLSVPALRAITAAAMGDLGGAVACLHQATRTSPVEAREAVWISRACLRMGQWSEAVAVLRTWLEGADDSEVRQAAAEARVTLVEAGWVLAQTGADRSGADAAAHDLAGVAAGDSEILRLRDAALAPAAGQPALEALQGAIERLQDGEAAQSLAIGCLTAGQPEAALRAIEAMRPAPQALYWRPLLQAIALNQLSRTGEALEALEVGAQDPVIRPLADALAGKYYASIGDRNAAVGAWNRALGARPQEASWHHALAALYLENGALDVALPHLQQAVEQAPGDMNFRLQLAKVLAGSGHGGEAVICYQMAMDRIEPSLVDLLEAGETALAAQLPAQAFEWFERAHRASPQDPRGLVGSARAAMALGKNRKARERIDLALKVAPNDPEVRLGQGEILAMQRDYASALQAFDQVRGLHGAAKSRWIQAKSRALMALGQGELAERSLLTELEQAEQDPGLWFPLAQIRQAKGEMAAAAEAAAQAVRLAPLNPDYRLGLAHICRQTGNLDRALDELERASELAPTDPRVPLEQGMVYEDRRDYRRALESFRRAIDLDTHCTQAYYRSGLVLKMLKSYPQAGQMLKRAAELAPVDRDVMHQLAAVRALELVHGPATGAVH